MNIAAALADLGKRVLLVDSDPQCNLTSYLIASDVLDDLLDRADTGKGSTVWSALKPVSEALGGFRLESAKRLPGFQQGVSAYRFRAEASTPIVQRSGSAVRSGRGDGGGPSVLGSPRTRSDRWA